MRAWSEEHLAEFEAVASRRDKDGAMVDRALEIVRRFITERGLILYGGLAIDYALRLQGSQIYPDGDRPDYDAFSPRNVDDAYDLADILMKAGFAEPGVVRAIHVQTMRVRVDGVFVADLTFMPEKVFVTMPTLDWMGLRVVHPDFQRMDQHLAFCFPFNDPPREDMKHRWKKDAARFNMLCRTYPVRSDIKPPPAGEWCRAQLSVPISDERIALHGWAAYAHLRQTLAETTGLMVGPPLGLGLEEDAFSVESPWPGPPGGSPDAPWEQVCLIASPEPKTIAGSSPVVAFDPYMDICPQLFITGGLGIVSTENRLLSVSRMKTPWGKVNVVTPHFLLLWFLYGAHRAQGGPFRDIFLAYYAATLDMLVAAEAYWADDMDGFAASPFYPSVTALLGKENRGTSYILQRVDIASQLKKTPPAMKLLGRDAAAAAKGLPERGYHPGAGGAHPQFEYDACFLYRRAGDFAKDI